jgi:site-specific recombinase XerD
LVQTSAPKLRAYQTVNDHRLNWGKLDQLQAKYPDMVLPIRIHDLRHTFVPLLVSGGASLEMIGSLLGHTQAGTTQRYAHLIESPLRAGVNAVGEMLRPRMKLVGS